jgi:hypothetical protein
MPQCAYCGTFVSAGETRCPQCREAIPEKIELHPVDAGLAWSQIRRGVLYMVLASVLMHFASPQRSLPLPVELHIPEAVTEYALPAFFLLGLGYTLLGAARKFGIVK